MTREDIEKASINNIEFQGELNLGNIIENACRESFVLGANWRINIVWHKPSEEPISFCSLLLIENNGGEFDLAYKFDPSTTKSWAYVKDLIPNMEE